MSYFNAIEQACPNLQFALDTVWQTDTSLGSEDRIPFAEFLVSPANKRGIAMEILPGRGKIRTVEVRYRPRGQESIVLEDQSNPNCSATGYYGNNVTEYTIDPSENLQVQELISIDANELACTDNAQYFAEKLAWHVDVLDRRVATELTNQAAALPGRWAAGLYGQTPTVVNGSDQLVIATQTSAAGPSYKAFAQMRNALDDTGYGATVGFFGGRTLREYMQYLQAGCCADYGVDLGEIMSQYGYAFAYDKRLVTALGSQDEALVLAPGALQVLNFTRAEGKAAFGSIVAAGSNYLYTTIASPRLGLGYDLTVKDDCGNINVSLTATVKVIALPNDMFTPDDELDRVNYVNKILVTNP